MSDATRYGDPLFDVSEHLVVITGALGLIGRELTRAFLARGARVVQVDTTFDQPYGNLEPVDEKCWALRCDVAQSIAVEDLCRKVVGELGPVDVLINGHQYKPEGFLEAVPETFPEELWDSIIDVNLKGTFLLCREFGRHMLTRGRGSIINLASTYGVVSSNPSLYADNSLGNPVAYSVSKGGVLLLTKYLGAHWAQRGVRVNAVTPHGVWNEHEATFISRFSEKSPMGRLSQAEEVVGAVVYLASGASSYVTGANLLVEGGWTAW